MQTVVAGKNSAATSKFITNLKATSDEKLFELSLQNDYQAFEELVKRYEDRIYRLGLKMLRSPEDAEDLLQKTFLSVFEKMNQFRGESSVSTWIFRIATNHALMKLRKDKGKNIDSLDAPVCLEQENLVPQIPAENTDVVELYERKELLEKLEQALQQLPDIYRLVFILRDVEGFSNKEVAKMLNLSVPAVKSRILRARLHLKDYLTGSQGKEAGKL
jgi:RNA polymerase sigma-70 factor, ECF subfamily